MILLTFIYFIICIVCPYVLTVANGTFSNKNEGISWNSHYIYAGFAFISFLAEVVVHRFAYYQVKHLLPTLINVDNLDSLDLSIGNRVKLFLKKHLSFMEWASYILNLVLSQLDRFDLYSDVCFLVIAMKQEFYVIGIISFAVLFGHLFSNCSKLLLLVGNVLSRSSRRLLNTHEIN